MNIYKGSRNFFVVILILGFNESFINCHSADVEPKEQFSSCYLDIENYDFSIREISFIMELYNKFERICKECVKQYTEKFEELDEEWNQKISLYPSAVTSFFKELKMEIQCVRLKSEINENEDDIVDITIMLWILFQTTKYSYLFAYGQLHYQNLITKTSDPAEIESYNTAARHCAYLSAYLGTFGINLENSSKIFSRYSTYIKSTNFGDSAYIKSSNYGSLVDLGNYSGTYIESLVEMKFILESYDSETKLIDIPKEVKCGAKKTPITLYEEFLQLVFFKPKHFVHPSKRDCTFVGDKKLWENAGELFKRWKGDDSINVDKVEDSTNNPVAQIFSKILSIFKPNLPNEPSSSLIGILREIELLKIQSKLNESVTSDHVKFGFDEGSEVKLVPIRKGFCKPKVGFAIQTQSGTFLADNTKLEEETYEDGTIGYKLNVEEEEITK